jgi:hypothetical protein
MNKEQEEYLNESIKKSSKSWKGVDVDEFLQDIRGEQPIKKGKDLIFISRIDNDGYMLSIVSFKFEESLKDEEFTLVPLSISKKTYIAFGMSAFVVKIRNNLN